LDSVPIKSPQTNSKKAKVATPLEATTPEQSKRIKGKKVQTQTIPTIVEE